MALRLGLSPCPNDTYIFAALLEGRVTVPGLAEPVAPHFADVEELNQLARQGRLDVTKISAAVASEILEEYVLLESGGALGRGCGPLLVAPRAVAPGALRHEPIAVPGLLTTANLLLSLHGGFDGPRRDMPFDRIMPALARGECAAGVLIHESRFTYADHGLVRVLDLGEWWEKSTGAPIPLGVIAARRSLGEERLRAIQAAVRASLEAANAAPERAMPLVRAHAQEMEESVLRQHIATFVTEYSLELGESGRAAVERLAKSAASLRGAELYAENPLFVPV